MTDKINARGVILDMTMEVIEGDKFSHTVLSQTLKKYQTLERQERAFISRVFTGTVKQYMTLDYIINSFASVPVHKMKPLIRNLLRISVYQLLYMDQIPESAICNEAVKLAKKRKFDKLSGFINGILRTIARKKEEIVLPSVEEKGVDALAIQYSTPHWLIDQWISDYGIDTAIAILSSTMKEKEVTIRCNLQKISPKELVNLLEEEGVTVKPHVYLEYAFNISEFDYLDKLDSFQKGYFTVQDVSSMLVTHTANIDSEDFIIDVCAAPGGKALHSAEKAKNVLARDLTDYKVNLIHTNITRLQMTNVTAQVWDALVLDETLIEKADVVIADLPCSGTGIIGKKADIKYKLKKNQQKELVQLQRDILSVIHRYVKPGGVLMFSTCTLNQEENLGNRDWFLSEFDYEAVSLDDQLPIDLQSETTIKGYLQLIQGIHPSDGFFISKMKRLVKR